MGLFNRKSKSKKAVEQETNEILDKNVVEIFPKDLIQEYPLGEMLGKVATTKTSIKNQSTLFCIRDTADTSAMMGTILQSVRLGHSLVILDINNQIYNTAKPLFRNNGYHIKYLDTLSENTDTWSIFDNMADENYVITKAKQIIDVLKWGFLSKDKISNSDYIAGLTITFAAMLAYVINVALLSSNKFAYIFNLLNQNTINNLDIIFNVAADTPKHLWFDFKDPYTESYINDLIRILNVLKKPAINKMINDDNLNMNRPSIGKTVYFINFIPEDFEEAVPLNLILNFSLSTFISYQSAYMEDMTGFAPPIPIDFFIFNLDLHQDLYEFIYHASQVAGRYYINFFATSVDFAYVYDKYYLLSEELSSIFQYVVLINNDAKNKEYFSEILDLTEDIPNINTKNDEEVIISNKTFVECKRYNIEKHPLFSMMTWDE